MNPSHGRHDGHTRPDPWRRSAPAPGRAIVEGLAHVQRTCPGWLVMWSPWRQAYTAFSMTNGEACVLDDATPGGIVQQIVHAELSMSIGRAPRMVVPV